MKLSESLAQRLRQSVQGCAVHSHGPIQSWAEIMSACSDGKADVEEVASLAIEACSRRIEELRKKGVSPTDPSLTKEELTRAFMERLFR
ncbi:MAG TPA: hypothetical protein VM598_01230 [Bdellovibrionota bacterium]|nr:hypothetical protein [Bdellovibrionota bacterium]